MFFKKRGDLDFFRKGGFECMGRRREGRGGCERHNVQL